MVKMRMGRGNRRSVAVRLCDWRLGTASCNCYYRRFYHLSLLMSKIMLDCCFIRFAPGFSILLAAELAASLLYIRQDLLLSVLSCFSLFFHLFLGLKSQIPDQLECPFIILLHFLSKLQVYILTRIQLLLNPITNNSLALLYLLDSI